MKTFFVLPGAGPGTKEATAAIGFDVGVPDPVGTGSTPTP